MAVRVGNGEGVQETSLTALSQARNCLPFVQGGQGPDSWERVLWVTAAPGDMGGPHFEVGERRPVPRPLPGALGWCHGAPVSRERRSEYVEEKGAWVPLGHWAAKCVKLAVGPGHSCPVFLVTFSRALPSSGQWAPTSQASLW